MPTAQQATVDEQKQSTADVLAQRNEHILVPIPLTEVGMPAPHMLAAPTEPEPLKKRLTRPLNQLKNLIKCKPP